MSLRKIRSSPILGTLQLLHQTSQLGLKLILLKEFTILLRSFICSWWRHFVISYYHDIALCMIKTIYCRDYLPGDVLDIQFCCRPNTNDINSIKRGLKARWLGKPCLKPSLICNTPKGGGWCCPVVFHLAPVWGRQSWLVWRGKECQAVWAHMDGRNWYPLLCKMH